MPKPIPRHRSASGGLPSSGPVLSDLSGDPEMKELIRLFVEEVPERIRHIEQFWSGQDFAQLRRVAHQLKGACGGYGFPDVGSAAGRLEQELGAVSDGRAGAHLEAVGRQVTELVGLCRRVSVS